MYMYCLIYENLQFCKVRREDAYLDFSFVPNYSYQRKACFFFSLKPFNRLV